MQTVLFHHQQALLNSWQQLRRNPWSHGLTMAVIGIALALPVILSIILSNFQEITQRWDVGNQISVYLKNTTTLTQAQKLVSQYQLKKGIKQVDYLSRDETLKEFSENSGFSDAIALLPENPMPAVIVIHPEASTSHSEVEKWAAELRGLSTVQLVQFDQEWLKRLSGLMQVISLGIWALSSLLIMAVALIIGNTIRLLIENRHEEISLITLIGANDGFVRRPFLYSGVIFGLGGGILAGLLVTLMLLMLQQPAENLAKLYNSTFTLNGMGFLEWIKVLLLSMAAGWMSAYVVVTHYLRKLMNRSAI